MGKSRPQTARGIAAYQKAMKKEAADKNPADKNPAGKNQAEKSRGKNHGNNPSLSAPRGLIKTGRKEPAEAKPEKLKRPDKKTEAPDSKFARAAKFMVLIGSDEASKILSRLDPGQVEAISREIASLKSISQEEADEVLEEFRSLLSPSYGYSGSSSGGLEEARRHLYAAFGPEQGEALLVRAIPEAAENSFDFLTDFSAEQLVLLFKNESPAACAMVFSRLPSKLSASVLANTTPERKLEIVRRIARLKETSPEVIERAAAALREKARHFGKAAPEEEIDGKSLLAGILKHSGPLFGSRLLEELEGSDPALGREMKDRLYTLDDVCSAADRPIQEKLRSMDDREIALLLRDRPEAFAKKITLNLSKARAVRVKEESDIIGPVPKIETEAAARDFLSWFRLGREEGRIMMLSDEDVLL